MPSGARGSASVAAALQAPASSLQDQAYDHLKRLIKSGQIAPGDRLLEAHVVKAFGVSRSPARRALEALCREHLIEEHGKRGYRVCGAATAEGDGRLAPLSPVKISQPRQWERMYSEVEQELLAKVLFGAVRINDSRLAQTYGVSRTVTRDLLARMHGVGLISKDEAGHWIAEQVTPQRIRHLYEMRELLEPQTLIDAAPFVPHAVLVQARENVLAALRGSPIDGALFDQVETDLHLEILSYSPNKEVLGALRRTHLLFAPTRHLFDPLLGIPLGMIEEALKEHLVIIDLLLENKAKKAASLLRRHLEDAVARWLGRFEVAARTGKITFPPYLAPLDSPAA